MAKLKEFAATHHWGPKTKEFESIFKEAGDGDDGLNFEQLQKFYADVGTKFFGESLAPLLTPDIFERFDFNGDGTLEFYQAKRSLKCVLYEVYHNYGGDVKEPVEFTTPEEKGYTIIKELARGGQGAAILASSAEYGKVVLKTYEKSNPNAGTIDEHIAEMEVLRELQHEGYVMHAWDIFQDDKCVYCVNELMAGGDLEALREKAASADIALTQNYFQNIFRQTLLGLDHIHDHGLMHCDLKEPNIMMKTTDLRNPQVAIIDFGLAHVCAGPGEAGGTPGYVPPETNSRHIWYPKGDIFSLGVAFFGLLADKTPNEKLGKMGVFQEGCRTLEDVVLFTATRELPLHLISEEYPGAMSWLPGMCSKDKKPRPRALQLLEHPFFAEKRNEGGAFTLFACCASPEVEEVDEVSITEYDQW
jgi:serine/threonine protein kinase